MPSGSAASSSWSPARRSGIGRATAFAFAEAGARIVAVDRDAEGRGHGRRSWPGWSARPRPGARRWTSATSRRWRSSPRRSPREYGIVDVLVNNAGIGLSGPFLRDHRRGLEEGPRRQSVGRHPRLPALRQADGRARPGRPHRQHRLGRGLSAHEGAARVQHVEGGRADAQRVPARGAGADRASASPRSARASSTPTSPPPRASPGSDEAEEKRRQEASPPGCTGCATTRRRRSPTRSCGRRENQAVVPVTPGGAAAPRLSSSRLRLPRVPAGDLATDGEPTGCDGGLRTGTAAGAGAERGVPDRGSGAPQRRHGPYDPRLPGPRSAAQAGAARPGQCVRRHASGPAAADRRSAGPRLHPGLDQGAAGGLGRRARARRGARPGRGGAGAVDGRGGGPDHPRRAGRAVRREAGRGRRRGGGGAGGAGARSRAGTTSSSCPARRSWPWPPSCTRPGCRCSAISGHLRELRGQVEHIASRFLEFTTEHVFARYLGHRPPTDADAAEAATLVRRLRPLAQQTVDAELARAMRTFATRHLQQHLTAEGPQPVESEPRSVPLPPETIRAVQALVGAGERGRLHHGGDRTGGTGQDIGRPHLNEQYIQPQFDQRALNWRAVVHRIANSLVDNYSWLWIKPVERFFQWRRDRDEGTLTG